MPSCGLSSDSLPPGSPWSRLAAGWAEEPGGGPRDVSPEPLPRPLWPRACSLSSLRLLHRESWATALSRSPLRLLLSLRFPDPWLFASSAGALSKARLCRRPTVRPHAPPASSSHCCAPVAVGGSHFKPSPRLLDLLFGKIVKVLNECSRAKSQNCLVN